MKSNILGDFNANLLGLNFAVAFQDFFDNLIYYIHTALIDVLTRVTQTSKTCLDNFCVC